MLLQSRSATNWRSSCKAIYTRSDNEMCSTDERIWGDAQKQSWHDKQMLGSFIGSEFLSPKIRPGPSVSSFVSRQSRCERLCKIWVSASEKWSPRQPQAITPRDARKQRLSRLHRETKQQRTLLQKAAQVSAEVGKCVPDFDFQKLGRSFWGKTTEPQRETIVLCRCRCHHAS